MDIGYKIRKIREEKGFTQSYMSMKLGISNKTYGRIEKGESKLYTDRIKKIAKVLEIDFRELIDFDKKNISINNNPEGSNKLLSILNQKYTEDKNQFYEKLLTEKENIIKHLEEENEFLRGLLKKEN